MKLEKYPRTQRATWERGWRSWQLVQLFLTKQMWSVVIFLVASCIAFYLFLAQLAIFQEPPAIQDGHEETTTLPKYFKYILLWSWKPPGIFAPFYKRGEGQETFDAINCSFTKCFVTANRRLFNGDLTKFDAILFHGEYIHTSGDLPKQRSRYQQYIFFTMESADNYPVCKKVFDGFFNLTSTYRLDSDIPYPYILIRDKNGKIVGPKQKMIWQKVVNADAKFVLKTQSKNATAAWFVSNCDDRSGRRKFVTALQNALLPYHLTVDVYGACGSFWCPRHYQSICNQMIKRNYFFYMSMENSFDEDYVTEKLLTALQNDVVPIVYGGADYTRFLPPGSYIDARKHSITELAAKIDKLIHSPKEYNQYFWWKDYYSYHDPKDVENVCAICEALHNDEMLSKTRSYYNFRDWWNPNERCQRK